MHSSARQDQIDDLIDIFNEHAARCGDISGALLCVEALSDPIEILGEIPPPLDSTPRHRRRMGVREYAPSTQDPLQLIRSSVNTAVALLRACERHGIGEGGSPSGQDARLLRGIWELAESRKSSRHQIFEIAGAVAELLSYSLHLWYDPAESDEKFGDLAIIVSVACVHTIYGSMDEGSAVDSCDELIERLDKAECHADRQARANPVEKVLPKAIRDDNLRKIVQTAVDQGFVLEKLSASHFRILHPDLPGMVVFSVSGDPRANQNTKSYLRKIGVIFR